VGGVPRRARPNTVIGIGGGTYLVALQEAVAPGLGLSRQGVVGLRVHVGSAMAGLRSGSELWVGLASATAGAVPSGGVDEVPSNLIPLYRRAGKRYGVPWAVLASINRSETGFGHNLHVSSAGAEGWMQFLPSTWRRWGTDANGDGKANPYSPADAITSAARYLAAAGAISDLARAVFAYNHSESYVLGVLTRAAVYAGAVPIARIAGALDPTGLGATR
jgi:soluble lytic murein transglycosylase-like protein